MIEAPPPDFDRDRWKDPRWSRWAFRNTAQFLPTLAIAPSVSPRGLVRQDRPEPEGWRGFLEATYATSAVLICDGHIVADWPAGAIEDSGPHMLFSVTKSIVGLTARMLIETGAIAADVSASRLLPDLSATAFGNATLADLLAMRDGVQFAETYADPDADIHRYSRGYWRDAQGGARVQLAALPVLPTVPGFSYRTPVADVIGAMLVAASGQRLAELIGELLWRPMGAAHPAHFVLDTAGAEIAGAGLNAAITDLARLALLLLDNGSRNGRQVIAQSIVAALFEGGDRDSFASSVPERPGWSYHDLWWHMGGGVIAALGVHGQRLIIDRDRRLVFVRTGAQPEPDNRPFDESHRHFLDTTPNVRHSS
mgnify:CR=1 FL=1